MVKKKYRPYPPEAKEEAIKLANKGLTYEAISERLGVPLSTLTYWFKGIVLRSPRIASEVKQKALSLYLKGWPLKAIRDELELDSTYSTKYWISNMNTNREPRRGKPGAYSKKTKDKAIKMVKSGMTYKEVSRLMDINVSTLRTWGMGVVRRKPRIPEEIKKEAIRLVLEEGWPAVAVQVHLNLNSEQILRYWLKRHKEDGVIPQ